MMILKPAIPTKFAVSFRSAMDDAPKPSPPHLSSPDGISVPESFRGGVNGSGRMPSTSDAALEMVRAMQPAGAAPLDADQVYLHYGEAASNAFVKDRYCFLGESTLRNIARGAASGVSFMGNHAIGSMLEPGQFAVGRTFAGQFQKSDNQMKATFGMYMRKGLKPNGDGGPSTDDLHAMIDAGTVFDVSATILGGMAQCDVCGNDMMAVSEETNAYLCPHIPGTKIGMSRRDTAAARSRGVLDGCASYSILDAELAEISAVYDGAVPGAGFRHSLSTQVDSDALALETSRGGHEGEEMELDKFAVALREHVTEPLLKAFGRKAADEDEAESLPKAGVLWQGEPVVAHLSPEVQAKMEMLERQNALLVEKLESISDRFGQSEQQSLIESARVSIRDMVRTFRMTPAEGEEWLAIAKADPSHFSAAKPALEHRRPMRQVTGSAEALTMGSDETTEVIEKARRMSREEKIPYQVAFTRVLAENPTAARQLAENVPTYRAERTA